MRADAPITDDELEKIAMELGIHNNLHDEGPDIKTQCKFCEKSFRNKRYMMEHYVRHHRAANQKLPHRCEVCGKGFLFCLYFTYLYLILILFFVRFAEKATKI